jgi:sugar-specific transcriptional regulator TrmB
MDKVIDFLKHLDLSDGETRIYLTLLKTDALSIRELALKTGIKRTTAYLYIDQLIEKGLIIKLVKGSRKLVTATEPEKNLSILTEEKLRAAKHMQNELPDMLKTITSSISPAIDNTEAEIKYYKGKNGVKKIYEEILKAKEQRSFVDATKISEFFPENLALFNEALTANPSFKMYEIFQNSSKEKIKNYLNLAGKQKNYFYKILPEGFKLTSQDIIIYNNKVSIISFTNNVSGVVLQSLDLYNNFKSLFDVMWKLLPEIKINNNK